MRNFNSIRKKKQKIFANFVSLEISLDGFAVTATDPGEFSSGQAETIDHGSQVLKSFLAVPFLFYDHN